MEDACKETNQDQDEFNKHVEKIKDVNGTKYIKYMATVDKNKIWQKWKAATKMLKAQRMAAINTNEAFGGYLTVRAIRKWIERVRVTKFARDRVEKFN